jgi:hypothetical protein
MGGWTGGWMDGWVEELMDGWVQGWVGLEAMASTGLPQYNLSTEYPSCVRCCGGNESLN